MITCIVQEDKQLFLPFKNLEPQVVGTFFVVRLSLTAYVNPSTVPNDFPAFHKIFLNMCTIHG